MNNSEYKVSKPEELKEFYNTTAVTDRYIEQRFKRPIFQLLHLAQVSAVQNLIDTLKPAEVLEIAPGPARVSAELRGISSGRMVEQSPLMLGHAAERLKTFGHSENWVLECNDIFEFEPKTKFDLIFSFRFIRHLEAAPRLSLLSKLQDWLTPSGVLVFDAINAQVSAPLRAKNPTAYTVYDVLYEKEELIKELDSLGFRVKNLRPVQCHFLLQSRIENMIPKRFSSLSLALIKLLESETATNPLEWIVECSKK